ncbi:hypothetical protein AM571_CH02449 [Rhizobium etli 8C-3]|uniref:Uncharacterized protein n=1 Tax=Rhizobium etli 8C-3 TaxID=538025 RepID=A0A1L5P533_RHIET|nr:hypothetical protein AM571_CH02449 [Rhizobium etli 8C-3]
MVPHCHQFCAIVVTPLAGCSGKPAAATVQYLENNVTSSPIYEKLKHWYEEQGVEFTGWGDTTGRFYGVGVHWASTRSTSGPEREDGR